MPKTEQIPSDFYRKGETARAVVARVAVSYTHLFSDNTSYTITNGKDGAAGADAVKWEIGTDGFWYKNDVKTLSLIHI